ncbi:hypothetical protein ACOTZD_12425 [Enterobacter cloacae complex sp. SHL022]|uniref:hypothetical protein n=1 Tax=Enterobacter cloacae complex sp. SHL022 TaxID=3412403 RepID=UPI003B9E81E4
MELEEERDATPGAVNEDAAMALAAMKITLASLEAEAVAEVCEGFTLRYIGHGPAPKSGVHIGDRLYTAPPVPVSVPECFVRFHEAVKSRHHGRMPEEVQNAFDACAAMLQGADGNIGKPLTIKLPDISSKAFWSGTGKNETFHPETYRRWVKEAIEISCTIARVDVEVK